MTKEALKLAAQAVLDRWNSPAWTWHKLGPTGDLMADLQEALAQPVQTEPVALVIDGVLVKSALPEKYTGHLYTTPPQREWVGLTDEEATEVYAKIQEEVNDHWDKGGTTMMFPTALYKAIEAKLKEKNT